MNENAVWRMELRHPSLMFTDSNAKGICYVTCEDDDRIGIVNESKGRKQILLISKKQAEVLLEELTEMLWFIGRGRLQEETRGRKKCLR